jgi:hypothetical protein
VQLPIVYYSLIEKPTTMKIRHIIISLLALSVTSYAQSDSYLTMKDTFKKGHDVHHFSVSGFLCRAVLSIADEHEYRDAILDVKNIKIITVPRREFTKRHLSLDGFKQVLAEDNFQELAHFRDHGDYVSVYLQENKKNKNRYFILVDEGDDIVALEIKGYVDPEMLVKMNHELAMSD